MIAGKSVPSAADVLDVVQYSTASLEQHQCCDATRHEASDEHAHQSVQQSPGWRHTQDYEAVANSDWWVQPHWVCAIAASLSQIGFLITTYEVINFPSFPLRPAEPAPTSS